MAFRRDVWIPCLASLIKLSCPWYIWQCVSRKISQLGLQSLLILLILLIALLPYFGNAILHHASLPQKLFWPDIIARFEQQFPTPDALISHVEFWKAVFSRYTSRHVLLYDEEYMYIYDAIDLQSGASLTAARRKYQQILQALDRKVRTKRLDTLTPEEARVYALFEKVSESRKFRNAARRIRTRCGQRDWFPAAIRRAGLYQEHFERIFEKHHLPVELTYLPFVESHFKYAAYSYAGAAGLWQFMPATARMYGLRMNAKIDERYDPFKSAESAAKLLKANYDIFHSWPLAVTAYNHGPKGLLQAIKHLQTTDLGEIVRHYRGARFGFYSKNYYAQFLAVVDVMRNSRKYFGHIEPFEPLRYEQVTLQHPMYVTEILQALAISKDDLMRLNRDLKSVVLQSRTPIPKHFTLKLPPGKKSQFLAKYAKLVD
ncbi:transglycosylase SLT domain-containing protein [candidate division KSB3 bacterium]|uniref:Transglycosylase SLT domain-containing protein n=1 Tax=candidate division KSB3 bacterium TaxID=2044937 RepID=A0A9D5JZE5_9BACT|nr:transglycosylase SLT domain-containing protein [candidate division KSB3 bacterium]MBD3327174.1 transglycosylase SLT domain-containing protein [candidate division KSB3 bacterium]